MKPLEILIKFIFLFNVVEYTTVFTDGKWIPRNNFDFLGPRNLVEEENSKNLAMMDKRDIPKPDWLASQGEEGQRNQNDGKETTYVGAVLEYEPYNEWTDEKKGYGVLRKNAEAVIEFASLAKLQYGADIMVIPEYGLTSLDVFPEDLDKFLTYTLYVPEPAMEFVPCHRTHEDSDNMEALKMLSCAAIANEMYLAINVAEMHPCSPSTVAKAPWPVTPSKDCPQGGYFFYNCEVVLDRRGTVVAKYRKEHLYMEDFFTPGPMDDKSALFLTDFNVLFSLQICFDMVFEHPGYNNAKYLGVKDVLMSTAWVDYLPFEAADSIQNWWSRNLKTNLLVAGHHNPELGKMGSGIFKGYSGELPAYTFDKDSGNVLVVSNVTTIKTTALTPKILTSETSYSLQGKSQSTTATPDGTLTHHKRHHLKVYEDLDNYTKVLLRHGKEGEIMDASACSNDGFCCDLSYQYSGDQIYMFLVYSGRFAVGSGRYHLAKQVCGVVWCKTTDYSTCVHSELGFMKHDSFGPFTITSSGLKTVSVSLVGIHKNLSLIRGDNLVFDLQRSSATLSTTERIPDLLVAAIYGRWYCEDDDVI